MFTPLYKLSVIGVVVPTVYIILVVLVTLSVPLLTALEIEITGDKPYMLWLLGDGLELVGLYGSFIGAKGVIKDGCVYGSGERGHVLALD